MPEDCCAWYSCQAHSLPKVGQRGKSMLLKVPAGRHNVAHHASGGKNGLQTGNPGRGDTRNSTKRSDPELRKTKHPMSPRRGFLAVFRASSHNFRCGPRCVVPTALTKTQNYPTRECRIDLSSPFQYSIHVNSYVQKTKQACLCCTCCVCVSSGTGAK